MSKCGTGCSVHFIVTGNLRAAWIHSVSNSLILINNNKRIHVFPFARTLQNIWVLSGIHEGLICDSLITFGWESMKEFTKGEEKMNKIAGQELALVPWIQMSRGVFWTIFVSDLRKNLSGALLCTSTWQFHEWPIELGAAKWTFCICVFCICVFVFVFSSSSICYHVGISWVANRALSSHVNILYLCILSLRVCICLFVF